MAISTFLQMQDYVLQRAGMGEARRSAAKDWVNKAHEDMLEAWDWPELLTEGYFDTVAEITTGTLTFTNADATVTSDNPPDFTAVDTTGRKIAAGYGKPAFLIDSITNSVELEMERPWAFATATSTSFVIYEDVYSLGTTVGKLYTDRVTLHDDNGRLIHPMTQGRALRYTDVPESSGSPEYFWVLGEDSSGATQVQLGPLAPDDVYVVRYWFRPKHVEMTADGDTPQLSTELLETVCEGALIRAYMMPEFADTQKAERQEARYQRKLADKIKQRKHAGPKLITPRTYDAHSPRRRMNINYPVSGT